MLVLLSVSGRVGVTLEPIVVVLRSGSAVLGVVVAVETAESVLDALLGVTLVSWLLLGGGGLVLGGL